MMIAALYSYIIFIREKMTNSAFVDVETMGTDMAGTAAGGSQLLFAITIAITIRRMENNDVNSRKSR